jgi:hypothetical protein
MLILIIDPIQLIKDQKIRMKNFKIKYIYLKYCNTPSINLKATLLYYTIVSCMYVLSFINKRAKCLIIMF